MRAEVVGHRGAQHGMERAPGDRLLQVVDEHLGVEVLAAEVAVHEGLVLALGDDPFDERVARLLDVGQLPGVGVALAAAARRVVVDLLAEQADHAGRGGVGAGHGQVQRQHAGTEDALAFVDERGELRAVVVQLGDHDGPRHVDRGALVPQHPRGAVDAFDGGQDEQGRVGGAQTGPQVTDEVRVARGVEDVDLDAGPLQRHHRKVDGTLLADLGVVVVADGRAGGDGARPRYGARADQQRLGQGRLAGAAVPHQDDVAYPARRGAEIIAGR